VKRLLVVAIGLVLGIGGAAGAQAQTGPYDYDDASGQDGTCTVSGPPGDTVTMCSDLRPGNGVAVTSPGVPAPDPVVEEVEPVPEPAPELEPEPAAPVASDAAVATATDQDADNYADELEPGLGLDPTNADTDVDGVADGDELNLYGTDPLAADSDGDGVTDGEELFGIYTDPLVWEEFGAAGGETGTG
jgi:hypothetical protein